MSANHPNQGIRLNKLLSDAGISSRRTADKIIEEGRVTVNGRKVFELGVRVDPAHDKVLVDGKPIKPVAQKIYILFYKPKGVLTTMNDPLNRPCIADFVEHLPVRVFAIGRLDYDSEGLLLLTNDGDFANRVMHPSKEVTKTYMVKLDGKPEERHFDKLRAGVPIEGGRVAAKHVESLSRKGLRKSENYSWAKIVITEGKNHQVRQMFAKVGFDVLKLQRVAIGRLRTASLKPGEMVFLSDTALAQVFQPDLPDEVKLKKSYKGRNTSQNQETPPSEQKELRPRPSSAKSSGDSRKRPSSASGPKSARKQFARRKGLSDLPSKAGAQDKGRRK